MASPAYSPVLAHNHYYYHHNSNGNSNGNSNSSNDVSRPSLGFPLGTALLLIVIFSLSGIFSCCYHWDKFRALRQSYSDQLDLEANHPSDPTKPLPNPLKQKETEVESVTVIMPGDHIAKFIAMPCPCEPPRIQKPVPVPTLDKPAKPPRFPVPLY